MNKKELLITIAKKNNFSFRETSNMMNAFIDSIADELSKEKNVKLTGFGTFFISKRKARQIVNPRDTSKLIQIDESYKPSFKPSGKFLKKIRSE